MLADVYEVDGKKNHTFKGGAPSHSTSRLR